MKNQERLPIHHLSCQTLSVRCDVILYRSGSDAAYSYDVILYRSRFDAAYRPCTAQAWSLIAKYASLSSLGNNAFIRFNNRFEMNGKVGSSAAL